MYKLVARPAAASALLLSLLGSAHAALPAGVETAIEGVQTDLLALLAALTTAGIAIWVGTVIYRRFKVK